MSTIASRASGNASAVGRPPLAYVDAVTKRFGSFSAVDDASLTVSPGEIVGLLGANGAGKTTLIRLLLGLVRPSSGQVSLFGGPPSRAARRRLGYVPQGLGLFVDLTVAENIEFVAGAFGIRARRDLPADLGAVRDRLVGGIGLGLQRRLAFIAALDHQPELLVLDEPTSGVDPLARARLWDVIHEQAERGAGVLVTTHYMQEAGQLDRLVLMSRGRVVAKGTERDIIGGTTAIEVRTDSWSEAFDALDASGLAVTLAGRSVRVADADPVDVKAALERAGLHADVTEAPATLEEKMVVIERSAS